MLVGETPGDREDQEGRPFVGPAGHELDKALEAVGLERGTIYVTNAVKHFKFEERGKRRIRHGATAAGALLGPKVRVTKDRGVPLDADVADVVMVTIHPSAILRGRSDQDRWALREGFQADVRAFADAIRN